MMNLLQGLICLCFCINTVTGGGQLWMRLVNFVNPNGKGNNGHFCDGKFFIRGSDCDHRIYICVDNVHGTNAMNRCQYGRVTTGVIPNQNSINFGSRAGNLRNPITFSMSSWPGAVKIKVSVWDDDDNADDFVDFMKLIYTGTSGRSSSTRSVRMFIQNRVRMTVELKVYCDQFYYGSDCATFCFARDDIFGHYTCEESTGRKICLDGWKGLDCNVRIDLCVSNPCQNGGFCHNWYNQYTCVCEDGYDGTNCENEIDECASQPCANGGSCTDLLGDYDCRCLDGWQGKDCTTNVNECHKNPCANGGACVDTKGSFHCICTEGYTGNLCDTDINECDTLPCQNNGTCNNSIGAFTCICPDNYNGTFCDQDVNECEDAPCHGNATCINDIGSYRCSCPSGMNGTHCEHDINECINNPCHGMATCKNTIGSFICQCPPGMTGHYCEVNIDDCSDTPCMSNGTCLDGIGSFTCVCPVDFTGLLCDFPVDSICSGGTNESIIYLDGKLDPKTEDRFKEGIKIIYRDFGGLNRHNLKLILSVHYIPLSSNHTITKVIVSASAEDTTLCGDFLSNILNTTNIIKINSILPYPLYKYENKPKMGRLQTKQEQVKYANTNWIASNWYIIAISVMVLVVVLAVLVLFVMRRRRQKMKNVVDRNRNNRETPPISESDMEPTDSGVPALSFDNELYAHYRPPVESSNLMLDYCGEE